MNRDSLFIIIALLSFTAGGDLFSGPKDLLNIAQSQKNAGISDKFSVKHSYQQIYGMYLLQYCDAKHREGVPVKMLEIGLGCKRADHNPLYSLLTRPEAQEGMFNGYKVWKSILSGPGDELWYAEHDKKCLQMRRSGLFTKNNLDGLRILEGDQGDKDTLLKWVRRANGKFDIIIDDGSHKNQDVYNSFQHLWPEVKPGGLYFIEDMQVSRESKYDNSGGRFIMANVLKDWIEQLMIPPPPPQLPSNSTSSGISSSSKERPHLRREEEEEGGSASSYPAATWTHRIPPGINWITCQREACVISKCAADSVVQCSA